MFARLATTTAAVATLLALPACATAASIGPAAPRSSSATSASPSARMFAELSLEQKVGQLFMVGTPADTASQDVLNAISQQHVGNVILTGRSHNGVSATKKVSDRLQAQVTASSTGGTGLFVSADQEGGQVQVLQGRGFSSMPSALDQGRQSTSTLQSNARTWGGQLASAGVNVDLGPVMDTVPSAQFAPHNPPIGAYDREFGYDPTTVSAHGRAVAAGLAASKVEATIKHFPGLGRVTANTDTSSGVTDSTTTRTDSYVTPFADAVKAGVPFLMMSTAIYSRIDSANPAAFSSTVVTGMVRGDLGFGGVVISDDLSAAKQVSGYSPADRALKFVQAGGDMILIIDTSNLSAMYNAVLSRAKSDSAFAAKVDASVKRILAAKQKLGLVG